MVKPESAFRDGHGVTGSIMHTAGSKGCFQLRPVFVGLCRGYHISSWNLR
jgi:hypothetical protein